MRRFLFAVAYVFLLTAQAPSQKNEIDHECLRRLLSEGQAAWKTVAAATRCIDVKYDVHQVGQGIVRGKKNSIDRKYRYDCTWDTLHSRILVERRVDNPPSITRRIVNPNYRFFVELLESGSPVLGSAQEIDPPWGPDMIEKELILPLETAYAIKGVLLEELISSSDYKPWVVKKIKMPKSEIERIYLEYQHIGASHPIPVLKGATYWAYLNPNHYWLIESAGIKQPNQEIDIRQELTYQESMLGVPFPATLKFFFKSKGGKEEDSYTFSTPVRSIRPDAEFTLPYYGIPETVIPKIAQSRKRTLIISVCVLGLVAAAGLYRLATRYARVKKN